MTSTNESAKKTLDNVPKVGDAASFRLWTDVEACTVIAVNKNGREVVLQVDDAKLLNGADSGEPDALQFTPGGFVGHVSGTQRYEYTRNPNGRTIVVTRRSIGDKTVYKKVGTRTNERGGVATFGERRKHYDYNF